MKNFLFQLKKKRKDPDPTISAVTNIHTPFYIQICKYPITWILAAALVNLGGRLCIRRGHLAKTLVVVMSQCITPTFSRYFCLPHIFNRPVQSDEEKCKKAKIQGNLCPIFLSVGLRCFGCFFDQG